MQQSKAQSGFTLIEVLIASVVLAVSIVGMLAAFPQAFRATMSSGQVAVLNYLATEKLEQLRALPYDDSDLNAGVLPALATDSTGQRYYPVPRYDENFSLRWTVSNGPTDGTGTPVPFIKTVVVEATHRTRYTILGVRIMNENSLTAVIGTLVTE